ncbi:MAG: conjugal transfer protein TraF [Acidobacteriota bacterium]|nr:conjugal transfer protein TraF [Acidobacteriota bacterium]
MAGAFVGVADDASAVYWNPAGLASGAYASFVFDFGRQEQVPDGRARSGAWRQTGRILALSVPPVGLAYYRVGVYASDPAEPAVLGVPGREEVRSSVHALTTSTVGVALLQSLNEYVVVGTTLKLVRGHAAAGFAKTADAADALSAAGELRSDAETKGDLDAGVMIAVNRMRLGLVARNLTTPSFKLDAAAGEAVEVERQVRVGGAWGSGWPGMSRVIVAVDADLTARAAPSGDRRDLAGGVETWWKTRRLGVRAGVRRSMIGESRSVVAAGVSAGVTASIFLEAHVARGQQDERAWSVGARFGF